MKIPRILLINPPQNLESILGAGKYFVQKYEPLGLLYIAGVLESNGYAVKVIDAFAENLSEEDLKKKIIEMNPTHIGVSTLTCNGELVFNLGRWIKITLPDTVVILGNIHASVFAEQYLSNNACDIVVHGEGEYTVLSVIQHLEENSSLSSIPGISYITREKKLITTDTKQSIENLDTIPFPLRSSVNQKNYVLSSISNQFFSGDMLSSGKSMITSRGCNFRCTFCVVNKGQKQRFRTPENVVREIEILSKEYNTKFITFMDPLFMADTKRVFEICSLIKNRQLHVQWVCDAHVNFISPDMIREMESAGCYELDFGIESGVQELLDSVCKKTTIEGIKYAVNTVKKYSKIRIGGLFILGLPGETKKESLQTIQFAKSLPLDMAQFSICTPYPGSRLYAELAKNGKLDTGIGPNNEIDTSVWNRYSAYFSFSDIEPIWTTEGLSAKQLRKLQKRAHREFYMKIPRIFQNLKRLKGSNILTVLKILWKGFF